jgi:rRNA maturation endonuclease Nob1
VTHTPTCPACGTKFPGDPCKKCGTQFETAKKDKAGKMPSATRKRRKHGR